MAKVTVRTLDALKPRPAVHRGGSDRGYKIAVDRGLYLRVANDGVKTWLVRYVIDGFKSNSAFPSRTPALPTMGTCRWPKR